MQIPYGCVLKRVRSKGECYAKNSDYRTKHKRDKD